MSRFSAFDGLRYDPNLIEYSAVIAPPYDVVDEDERAQLAAKSPYNAIHVELPVPDDSLGLDRYENAARIFGEWKSTNVLVRDHPSALYIYKMTFVSETCGVRSTTGVIGALGLDVPGGTEVLPHEQTMPKPKGDRLDLLRASGANLSPIWGLSLARGLALACAKATEHRLIAEHAVDEDGVVHDLWVIDDLAQIDEITALVQSTPIIIADGHHRYETANFYRGEQLEDPSRKTGAFNAVMALIVELSSEELAVEAIHRLISGLPEDFDLLRAFEASFLIESGPEDPIELNGALVSAAALGLVLPQGNYLLIPKPEVIKAAAFDLDSSRLDVALLDLPAHELSYQHGAVAVARAVREKVAQAGVLLRPASVEQIEDTAHSGRRMPPKSTFFYPKPRTGMVYRSVKD